MLLRANTLAKGFSGARVETIELLLGVLGAGIVPHVPSRGSVGASGDLAPLAHLALPLVGEGEATRGRPPRERGRGARRRGVVADHARGEGRPVADQRNAVHDRHGVPRARPRPAAGACRGRGVRDVGGGAPGDADELPPGDPRGAAACRTAAQCGDAASAARRLGDRRVAPVVRQGAGRVLAALRATGARRQPRPPRPRRADGRCRAERGDRQPARSSGGGAHCLERQLPRPADRDRARLHRDRVRGAREHQRAADGAAREPEPVGRPAARSWSRARRGSTRAS